MISRTSLLLSQVHNVCVNRARARVAVIAPYLIQQAVTAQCFRGVRDEVGQHCKLLRGEFDRIATASHFVPSNVHFDIAEAIGR